MSASPLLSHVVDTKQPQMQQSNQSNNQSNPQSDNPLAAQTQKHAMQFHDLQTFNHAVQLQQLACLTPVRSRLQEDEEPPKRKRGRPSKTEQEYLQKWYTDRGLDYQPPPKIVKNKPIPGTESDTQSKRGRKSQSDDGMPLDASNLNIMTQQMYNPNDPRARYMSSPFDSSSSPQRHPRYGAIEAYIDSLPDSQSITEFMTHIAAYARMRVKHLSAPPPPEPSHPISPSKADSSDGSHPQSPVVDNAQMTMGETS